jgi:hypothetical protein
MAKRPNKKKDNDLMLLLGLVAGSLATGFVSTQGANLLPQPVKGFAPAVPMVGGYFLKNNANPFIKGAGYGMIGSGGVGLAKQLLPGVFGVPTYRKRITTSRMGMPASQGILSMPANQGIMNQRFTGSRYRNVTEPKAA